MNWSIEARGVNQHQTVNQLRVRGGKIYGNPSTQRVAHHRRFRNAFHSHELLKEIYKGRNLVLDHRLGRTAETNLVDGIHVTIPGNRTEGKRPIGGGSHHPMQENHAWPRARFEVTNFLAINSDRFFRGHGRWPDLRL